MGGRSGRSPHSASLFGRRTRRLPPPPAFLLLGGRSAPPRGPQEVARAWKSPEGRLSSLHGPRKVGQRPWRPGHRPAPGEPAAPPAGAAWGRRGRARGLLAQPAPSSSLVHVRFLKGGSVWPEDKGATVTDGRGEGKILIIVFGLVKPVEGPFRGDKSLHLSSPSHVITPVTGGTPLPLGLLDSARPEGEGRGR